MMQCILQSHYGALEVELPMPGGAACLIPHILVQAPKAAQVSQDVCYPCRYRLEQSHVSRCMLMMRCIRNLILEPWRRNFPCLGSSVYVHDAIYLQSHRGALEVELPMPRGAACLIPHACAGAQGCSSLPGCLLFLQVSLGAKPCFSVNAHGAL
jgi:hypothetical protein